MMKITFVISSSSDDYWHDTNAMCINGAKMLASKMYQPTINGDILVAHKHTDDLGFSTYHPVAVKYGYDKWRGV